MNPQETTEAANRLKQDLHWLSERTLAVAKDVETILTALEAMPKSKPKIMFMTPGNLYGVSPWCSGMGC